MSWKSSKILHVNRKAYFLDQTRWKLQRQWNECRCCVGQWRMDGHTFDSGFMTSLMTIDEEMRRQMCQGLLTPKQCSAVENLYLIRESNSLSLIYRQLKNIKIILWKWSDCKLIFCSLFLHTAVLIKRW